MMRTNDSKMLFEQYKQDFDYCEAIIRKHSQTFYKAFSKLSPEKAKSVYAVYAFCRIADDLVDEEKNLSGLIQLQHELELFEQGQEIDHPIWRALRVVFTTYQMDITPFYDMVTGQKMDLQFEQPQTQQDLETYSYYVAGSVGLMLLPLLTDVPETVQKEAVALGKAMQITNILRDIGEDLGKKRVYIPMAVITEHGYSLAELHSHTLNEAFINMWEFEAKEAEKFYDQALNLVPYVNEDSKKALLLALLLYRELLDTIRGNGYQCFDTRNVVGKLKMVELFQRADKLLQDAKGPIQS